MLYGSHENDETYDRYERKDIPGDLRPHYRQFKPMFWAYVCPHCKTVFASKWGGMPGAFRAHITPLKDDNGNDISAGCLFHPIKRAAAGSKRKEEVNGF